MVYIKLLDKRIFPYYIKPEKDEIFSSWLCRLALNHNIKPQSFILNYLGRDFPIFNRDVDLSPTKKLLSIIESHTPLSKKEINNLFLTSYESYAYEHKGAKGTSTSNILILGINHRKRKRHGVQFCPKCIINDPFYKKTWRLQTSILCVECNCYLDDKCPKCLSPIIYHRVNISNNSSTMNYKPLNICYNCKSSLSTKKIIKAPSESEIEYQKFMNTTIEKGYNNISNYSFEYIKVLLLLSSRLGNPSKNNRFRRSLDNENKLPIINTPIRFWNIEERIFYLPYIHRLLNDKEQLLKTIKKGKIMKSYLDPENVLPYWFIKNLIH